MSPPLSLRSGDGTYRDPRDEIHAIEPGGFGGGAFQLYRYSPTGTLLGQFTLGLKTWGNVIDNFQLYPVGTYLVMVAPGKSALGTIIRPTFVIDPSNGDIVFASMIVG